MKTRVVFPTKVPIYSRKHLYAKWLKAYLNSTATPTACWRFSTAWPHPDGTYSTSPARCTHRRTNDDDHDDDCAFGQWSFGSCVFENAATAGGASAHLLAPKASAFQASPCQWNGEPLSGGPT